MSFTLIAQIIISLVLIVLITLQSRDSSLGSGFSSVTQTGLHTKTGPEKIIYLLTIILSCLFVGLSFVNVLLFK